MGVQRARLEWVQLYSRPAMPTWFAAPAASAGHERSAAVSGHLSPAAASRCKIRRAVDSAIPSAARFRCATARRPSNAVPRACSASQSSLLASALSRAKPKERPLIGPAETPPTRAASDRNGRRLHPGISRSMPYLWLNVILSEGARRRPHRLGGSDNHCRRRYRGPAQDRRARPRSVGS